MIPEELELMFAEVKTPVICATADGDGPHASTMNWWYNEDGSFFMNPAGGTRKARTMLMGDEVCFATLEHMVKGKRGFMVWGRIAERETGFLALLKNLRNKVNILTKHGGLGVNLDTMRFGWTYAFHGDIYYSTLPWKGYFIKVEPKKIRYWLGDGETKEISFD